MNGREEKKEKKKYYRGNREGEFFLEGVVFQPRHRLRQFLGSCGFARRDFWHLENGRQARVFFRIRPIARSISRLHCFNLLLLIKARVIACYTIQRSVSPSIHRIARISIDNLAAVSHGTTYKDSIIDRRLPTVITLPRRLLVIRISTQHVPLVIILTRLPRSVLIRSNGQWFRNFARNPILHFINLISHCFARRLLRHTVILRWISRGKTLMETRPLVARSMIALHQCRIIRDSRTIVRSYNC